MKNTEYRDNKGEQVKLMKNTEYRDSQGEDK